MTTKKIWPYLALVFGVATSLIGGGFVVTYVRDAIFARTGDPDQSLLFWYLPILFIGVMGLGTGLGACGWGFTRLREIGRDYPGKKGK